MLASASWQVRGTTPYRSCIVNVRFEGMLGQLPVTPGLVQVNVLPPTRPERANVPVQVPPDIDIALKVAVPLKPPVVVTPEIVPLQFWVDQVPVTVEPAWDRTNTVATPFMTVSSRLLLDDCVYPNVPDQLPPT